MSLGLGWTIAFLALDIVPLFLNYLSYYIYIDKHDLDKTKSQKIFNMGQVGGVISAVMFLLLMNLFKLIGL